MTRRTRGRVTYGLLISLTRQNWVYDIIGALEWIALQRDVRLINLSAGELGVDSDLLEVFAELSTVDLLPVIAVGNEGENTSRWPGNYPTVVSVGAIDQGHGVWWGSGGCEIEYNHQRYAVPSLVAPGKGIYSSVPGGAYESQTGTSLAAPIVSGVAALILEKTPKIPVGELKDVLLTTCRDLGLKPVRQGKGLVQITGALK